MWLQIITSLVMMVISSALTAATQPKPQTPEAGKLDVPTAEEGKTVGVLFGTDVIKDANVVFYGDAATSEIRSSGGGKK